MRARGMNHRGRVAAHEGIDLPLAFDRRGQGRQMLRALRSRSEPLSLPDFTLANIGGAIFAPLARLWSGGRKSHG